MTWLHDENGNPITWVAAREFLTKDSGAREEPHPGGAVRDVRIGKGRYDLIPPIPLRRLAELYERGADKYAERNWESGMPLTRCYDSMIRHANQWLEGDTEEDHLAAVAWNAFAIIHYEEMIIRGILPKTLDNRPNWQPDGT